MVICLERGADLHIAQLMPLPLTVSCFSKIQIGFTLLVPAYPSSPGKKGHETGVCILFFNYKIVQYYIYCTKDSSQPWLRTGDT